MSESSRHSRAVATFPPFVEVEVAYEQGLTDVDPAPWRAFEVWTRNSIYGLDWRMVCISVFDRATEDPIDNHTFQGATLIGGQRRLEGSVEVSHPLPRPGHEAVFKRGDLRLMTTSEVERFVLRLRTITVSQDGVLSAWERLARPG